MYSFSVLGVYSLKIKDYKPVFLLASNCIKIKIYWYQVGGIPDQLE